MSIVIPKGISPRFGCHPKNYADIANALQTIGHVIIDDAFDLKRLQQCRMGVTDIFDKLDDDYKKENLTEGAIYSYLGSATSFDASPNGNFYVDLYMSMIQSSSIIDMFSSLLNGDVAAIHGPVIRRYNSDYPARYVPFHEDTQISDYYKNAYRSQASFTMWTPLCDVDVFSSTLLLFMPGYRVPIPIEEKLNKINYLFNMSAQNLSCDKFWELPEAKNYHRVLNTLVKELGENIYAPQLKLGSVLIFTRDVSHGPFVHKEIRSKNRYSIDIRFIGDFDKSVTYKCKERAFIFKKYTRNSYDPFIKNHTPITSSCAQLSSFQDQIKTLEQQITRLQTQSILGQFKKILRPIVKPVLRALHLKY